MIDAARDPATQMTLRGVFDRFYEEMHPKASKNMMSDYRTALTHWERYTADPTMGQLASEKPQDKRMFRIMLQRYHSDLQDFGIARVTTANKYLRSILALLNMAGPNQKGNPNGLDILGWVPAIRQADEPEPEPRQLDDDSINAIYEACDTANWPVIHGVETCDWWRGLLVFLTFVGYRRGD